VKQIRRIGKRRAAGGARAKKASEKVRASAPRERLEVDERREQLVRLGIDLFSTRTYDEVSIDELARAAGISKGLLYHYFPTKRDFYVATVREGARQLLERTVTPDDMPPLERLRAGLDAYLDYVEEHGPAYAALLRGGIGSDPEVARIVDETRAQVCDRMVQGAPVVAPGPLVRVALRAWVGFVETAALDWLDKRLVARDAVRDLAIAVLMSAVEAAAAREGESK
jgi:AcrR family transcriptional regulator